MFGFSKKKKESKVNVTENPTVLTNEEKKTIEQDIEKSLTIVEKESNNLLEEDLAKLYEEIGLNYMKLEDDENAILCLEKSLEIYPTISDGYKKLLNLYNAKRAEAAKNKDDDGIQYYMNKLDEMRNIGKRITVIRK